MAWNIRASFFELEFVFLKKETSYNIYHSDLGYHHIPEHPARRCIEKQSQYYLMFHL